MPRLSGSFIAIMSLLMVGIATCGGVVFSAVQSIGVPPATAAPAMPIDAVVRIENQGGICSGVLIGDGFILTASHCTEDSPSVDVILTNGTKFKGEVMWMSDLRKNGYDISLIHIDAPSYESNTGEKLASAHLSCAPNYVGQSITVIGNPNGERFLYSWGRVSGLGAMAYEKWWKDLTALDITIAPGNSGGPVFNDKGEVIGIAVAGMVVTGRGAFPFAFMVPGEAICHVMGRA